MSGSTNLANGFGRETHTAHTLARKFVSLDLKKRFQPFLINGEWQRLKELSMDRKVRHLVSPDACHTLCMFVYEGQMAYSLLFYSTKWTRLLCIRLC